jgi:type I restriction enzyme M protein
MNPPFKGAVDKGDVNPSLPNTTTKTELLFLHLILRALDMGGRGAVIVPDGVLFGSSKAHVEIRQKLIEENRLDGVVSMPSGVFKPYAGVSTAILLFTRGATTDPHRVWFYDMEHDGFSLDDKRQPVAANDLPDVLRCWRQRKDGQFQTDRDRRLNELKTQVAPLKARRLQLHADINRVTFESIVTPANPKGLQDPLGLLKANLASLEAQIAPLQAEIDQLSRQFWVSKEQVRANKYDLSASRYREVDQDGVYYEKPAVTLERMLKLEDVMAQEIKQIETLPFTPAEYAAACGGDESGPVSPPAGGET